MGERQAPRTLCQWSFPTGLDGGQLHVGSPGRLCDVGARDRPLTVAEEASVVITIRWPSLPAIAT